MRPEHHIREDIKEVVLCGLIDTVVFILQFGLDLNKRFIDIPYSVLPFATIRYC